MKIPLEKEEESAAEVEEEDVNFFHIPKMTQMMKMSKNLKTNPSLPAKIVRNLAIIPMNARFPRRISPGKTKKRQI